MKKHDLDKYISFTNQHEGHMSIYHFKMINELIKNDKSLLLTNNYQKFFNQLLNISDIKNLTSILNISQVSLYRQKDDLQSNNLLYKKIVRLQLLLSSLNDE